MIWLRPSASTQEKRVKAYRSLDAYNYFVSGKVGSICSYNVDDVYLVFGEVGEVGAS